jgi:uncharacterized iron-regulated protein
MTYVEVVQRLREADLVFLGEQHDNPVHHAIRARLVSDLHRPGLRLVFEQLPVAGGQAFLIPPQEGDLLPFLQRQGFREKAWAWPLHAPLFAIAQTLSIPVAGGNLAPGTGRRIYAQGSAALPPEVEQALMQAPLLAQERAALDEALVEGHCGQLPSAMLPMMRLIQQATDVSLVLNAYAHRPSVVIAGNGHVQKIFGMPQAARRIFPHTNLWSVGFVEQPAIAHADRGSQDQAERQRFESLIPGSEDQQRYDLIWITPGVDRVDPCKDFSLGGKTR